MYSFDTAARGYHYYRRYWQPEINQTLNLSHEKKKKQSFRFVCNKNV